jgi:hypothetical protein
MRIVKSYREVCPQERKATLTYQKDTERKLRPQMQPTVADAVD